jgi:hypothetical protein
MPDPTWQELYNAAILEFDLTKPKFQNFGLNFLNE